MSSEFSSRTVESNVTTEIEGFFRRIFRMNVRVILCERKSVLGGVISKAMRRVIVVVVEIKIK